jgi:hypothetical protein
VKNALKKLKKGSSMIYIDRLLMQQLILSFARLAIVLSVLRLTGFDST